MARRLSTSQRVNIARGGALIQCVAGLLVLGGCFGNPPLGRVHGRITLDGMPLRHAFVTFLPEHGRPAQAETDGHGNYELIYAPYRMGALLGPNVVRVSTYQPPEGGDTLDDGTPNPDPGIPELVPEWYNAESVLVRDVQRGDNHFDFDLTTRPPVSPNADGSLGR
ncbi:hypothetical protein Pan216_13210 [Planctomycetes bacterium Pan216]|uniref:Nickel uptake substrate-specific transmembrane region n=1 Tax=Kolteria novifilia TaxID=2527975 RepID=A0A518B0I3_9BACT|nr:hypothetical protein Pan216_13210 [Planctomycetes bacterium Pan216]